MRSAGRRPLLWQFPPCLLCRVLISLLDSPATSLCGQFIGFLMQLPGLTSCFLLPAQSRSHLKHPGSRKELRKSGPRSLKHVVVNPLPLKQFDSCQSDTWDVLPLPSSTCLHALPLFPSALGGLSILLMLSLFSSKRKCVFSSYSSASGAPGHARFTSFLFTSKSLRWKISKLSV